MQGLKNMITKNAFSFLFCLAISFKISAQIDKESQNPVHQIIELDLGEKDTIVLKQEATSFYIKIKSFSTNQITIATDKENFSFNKNNLEGTFIILKNPSRFFSFESEKVVKNVSIHFLFSGITPKTESIGKTKKLNACSRPSTIDQAVWRAGLPAPVLKPPFSNVDHLIIHHSEGRNDTITDFTYVVRQIYLFHTQVRGWNDIGYNFLIAQNGLIYEGREGAGAINEENAVGAHLCGKNTGTMGICLLGNYEEVTPTNAAINTLINLLAWKLVKDSLNALGSNYHPGYSKDILPQIAGHKDACNTLCPGKHLYSLIPAIRKKADTLAASCGGSPPKPPLIAHISGCINTPFYVRAIGALNGFYNWYTADTRLLNNHDSIYVTPQIQSDYTVYVSAKNASGESTLKKITISPDSLSASGCINEVEKTTPEELINIYPNPGNGMINILAKGFHPLKIEILDLEGRKLMQTTMIKSSDNIDATFLPAGIYIIRIIAGKRIVNKKLILIK